MQWKLKVRYLIAGALFTLAIAFDGIAARPNIVMIVGDDIGYSDLGCYGSAIDTPNLDSLAGGGLRFRNFYTNNMCVPTRAAMLTGCYNTLAKPTSILNPHCVTAPEMLREVGYTTLMSGKWHLSPNDKAGTPLDRGFDHWYGTYLGATSFFSPISLTRDRENVEHEYENNPGYYYTDAVTDNALRFVEDSLEEGEGQQPIFLYLAYTAAHWPLHAKPEDMERYEGHFSEGWDVLRERRHARMKELGVVDSDWALSERHPDVPAWKDEPHKKWQERRMEVYAAQITNMDWNIGRVIDLLKKRGIFENTLILYQNDNGGCHVEYTTDRVGPFLTKTTRDGRPMIPGNIPNLMPGPEHTLQSYGYGWANLGNTPFRLFKQHDHEGGIRSPLIAHWPDGITAKGTVVDDLVHVTDLMPTFLSLGDTYYPESYKGRTIEPVAGRDVSAVFEGHSLVEPEALFWRHSKGRAVRSGKWKLVSENKKAWELYDIASDGTELNDLAGENETRVDELGKRWLNWDSDIKHRTDRLRAR